MQITLFNLAQRFVGIKEIPGIQDNNFLQWCLEVDGMDPAEVHDEIPWCSAFVNRVAWLLRLPRSKSLAARSWLTVGVPITLAEARPGWDIVILKRGSMPQPGPEVLAAPGHVTLFAAAAGDNFYGLGGNQGNSVSVAPFSVSNILGVRRLYTCDN
jgi:uncharacterized protein (TIGR02594 family)